MKDDCFQGLLKRYSSLSLQIYFPNISFDSIKPHYSAKGEREVAMDQSFFTAYRQNAIRPEEVLMAVHIPYTEQVSFSLAIGWKFASFWRFFQNK